MTLYALGFWMFLLFLSKTTISGMKSEIYLNFQYKFLIFYLLLSFTKDKFHDIVILFIVFFFLIMRYSTNKIYVVRF